MLLLGFVSGCTGSIHVILEVDFLVFASSVIKVSRTWPCYTFGPDALHFRSRLKAVKPYKTEGYICISTLMSSVLSNIHLLSINNPNTGLFAVDRT